MLVREYMTRHPLLVDPEMTMIEARRYMGENNVRHLPVVGDGKRLLGLITRQTLLVDPARLGSLDLWDIARTLSGLKVKDVMVKVKDVVTVGSDVTIEEAATLMVEKKVGCLPVVEDGIVVGIITEIDLLAHLAEMMASRRPGVRVTMRMPDRKGELARLVTCINAQGWGIMALGGAYVPKEPDKWDAVVKVRYVSKEEVVAALQMVEGQEIIDVREIEQAA
jgi:acetoin utilization protein AcuB